MYTHVMVMVIFYVYGQFMDASFVDQLLYPPFKPYVAASIPIFANKPPKNPIPRILNLIHSHSY